MIPVIILSLLLLSCYSSVEKKGVPVITFFVTGTVLKISIFDSKGDVIKIKDEVFQGGNKVKGSTANFDRMNNNIIEFTIDFNSPSMGKYKVVITATDRKNNVVSNSFIY